MQLSPGKLWGMRRMADSNGLFKMTAVDQRPPIKNPIAAYLGADEAPWKDVAHFKGMLVDTLQSLSSAMLLDPHYAIPYSLDRLSPAKGLIVTLEDSLFVDSPEGRMSSNIDNWSVEKIKRMGGDAVKVLAWYRPDASPAVCQAQQDYVKRIGADCARFDIPFLFELLVYPLASDAHQTREYVEMKGKKADDVLASVEEFAKPEYGVDIELADPEQPHRGRGLDLYEKRIRAEAEFEPSIDVDHRPDLELALEDQPDSRSDIDRLEDEETGIASGGESTTQVIPISGNPQKLFYRVVEETP